MQNTLLSLAFSAGLATFLNPCGFALLPVYIAYYFRTEGLEKASTLKKLFYGAIFGGIVSLGFIFTFSIIGLVISLIGKGVIQYIGYFDFAIGLILAIIGVLFLFNLEGKFGFSKITNLGEKLKSNTIKNRHLSFFVYGIGFAVAAVGCSFPIFLFVMTAALKETAFYGFLAFISYALGMSLFMILFSIAVALSKNVVEKTLKRFLPYIYKLGALIVLIAGLALMYNQVFVMKIFW